MPKIAFLALDDIHHLHHTVPVALELSRDKNYECIIYVQSHALTLTQKIAALFPTHRCRIEILSPSWVYKSILFFRWRLCSARRIIRRHASMLLTFDAIFTCDMNVDELIKRSKKRPKRPCFFANSHGAGDRTRPIHLLAEYDYVLICGEKKRRLFNLNPENAAVTGYPKFDIVPSDFRPKLFTDDRPVLLYNPHACLPISSWSAWGLDILEYFYQNNQYNFIFAPHCNLFRRQFSVRKIPKKYFTAAHMIIDLGSEKSVDMTYTQAADIYLGDVSSQVYEFIRRPRPCIFLNPRRMAWQGDERYANWNFGTVINEFWELKKLLSQPSLPDPQVELQQSYFKDAFSITAETAASRSAAAIRQRLAHHMG